MANTTVTTDKTTYNAGEQVTVTVTSTNLSPAVPPTIEHRTATAVRTFDTGEVNSVSEAWDVVTDPGSPAQTVVSTVVTDDAGNTYVQVDQDHYTTTAA